MTLQHTPQMNQKAFQFSEDLNALKRCLRGASDVLENGKLRLENVSMAQVGMNIRVILLLAIQIFTFIVWLQLLTFSKTFCRQERIVMIVFGARPTWKWISALKLISYDASHLNLGRLSWSYRIILWVKHTTDHSVWQIVQCVGGPGETRYCPVSEGENWWLCNVENSLKTINKLWDGA